MPALAQGGAHPLPHGDHGHVHPQGEQPHAPNQQDGPKEEQHQGARVQGGDGDGQQKNNGSYREHRGHRLPDLFHQMSVDSHGLRSLFYEDNAIIPEEPGGS